MVWNSTGFFMPLWFSLNFIYINFRKKISNCLILYLADANTHSDPCYFLRKASCLLGLTLLLAYSELGDRRSTCAKTVTLLLNSFWYDRVELKQETKFSGLCPAFCSFHWHWLRNCERYSTNGNVYLFLETYWQQEMQSETSSSVLRSSSVFKKSDV